MLVATCGSAARKLITSEVERINEQRLEVAAHTSAWVLPQGDVWLLRFTEQSLYAGHHLRFGVGNYQLPLPLLDSFHFQHF